MILMFCQTLSCPDRSGRVVHSLQTSFYMLTPRPTVPFVMVEIRRHIKRHFPVTKVGQFIPIFSQNETVGSDVLPIHGIVTHHKYML